MFNNARAGYSADDAAYNKRKAKSAALILNALSNIGVEQPGPAPVPEAIKESNAFGEVMLEALREFDSALPRSYVKEIETWKEKQASDRARERNRQAVAEAAHVAALCSAGDLHRRIVSLKNELYANWRQVQVVGHPNSKQILVDQIGRRELVQLQNRFIQEFGYDRWGDFAVTCLR